MNTTATVHPFKRYEKTTIHSHDEMHRIPTQELEPDFENNYMGARFYDPDLGRFLQVDPARQFWNSYSYVGNNPVMLNDPTGNAGVAFQGTISVAGVFGSVVFSGGIAVGNRATLSETYWMNQNFEHGTGHKFGKHIEFGAKYHAKAQVYGGIDTYLGVGIEAGFNGIFSVTLGDIENITSGRVYGFTGGGSLGLGAGPGLFITEKGAQELILHFSGEKQLGGLEITNLLLDHLIIEMGVKSGAGEFVGIGGGMNHVFAEKDLTVLYGKLKDVAIDTSQKIQKMENGIELLINFEEAFEVWNRR